MGIQIPQFAGETPTKVDSDGYNSRERYIWHLRSKDAKGLDIKIEPDNSNGWMTNIYVVEWNGSDYIEEKDPISRSTNEKLSAAVKCAENSVKEICSKNNDLTYIKNALF